MRVGKPTRTNKWTPEMEQTLLDLKAAGEHFRDIAPKLGVTITATEKRFQKLKKRKHDTLADSDGNDGA